MDTLAQALSDHAVTMTLLRRQERELLDQLAAAGVRVQDAELGAGRADGAKRAGRGADPGAGPRDEPGAVCEQRWVHRLHMLRTNSGYAASRLRRQAAVVRESLETLGDPGAIEPLGAREAW